MPIVQITILPQLGEKKAEMSRVITDDIHRITGIPKEVITIMFHEFSSYLLDVLLCYIYGLVCRSMWELIKGNMMKMVLISLFLIISIQVKSQHSEIEIYMVQSNSLMKGTLEESQGDSIRIRVDSLHTLSFAKTELEGRELPVSMEVKNLRRKLVFDEARKGHEFIPGMFQIKNGEKTKGYILLVLTGIGCVGLVATLGVLVVDVFSINGFVDLIGILTNTGEVLTPTLIIYSIASIWSNQDHWHTIKKMVNNRYYYRGDIIPKMTINN